ncbi:hypothetical protein UM93_15650 [Psychromicrobium lacuslunae]|uniref:Uncharacterized protein n=2 Tax=Psychromicrobium lacuslunae TaxID=1618207 RepID=A0A0D4C2E9_9MICC|nr:hypothetical protein UM93_15650 [Psychromicrobium lacuslunae]
MAQEDTVPRPTEEISVSSVGKGIAWNALASVLPQFLTLLLSIAVGRLLGPAEQGVQSFMIFVATTASVVCALGLPVALQRSVSEALGAKAPERLRYLVNWSLSSSFLPGLIAAGVTFAVGRIYEPGRWVDWLAVTVYAAATTVHSVSSQALLGMRKYRAASVIGLSGQLIGVPLTILWLFFGGGITAVVLVLSVTSTLSAVITIWLLRRAIAELGLVPAARLARLDRADRRSARKALLVFAFGGGISVLLDTVVMQRSELAFLAYFHSEVPEHLAFYNVAFNATQVAVRLPLALIPVILPTVSALAAAGLLDKVRRGYAGAQRIMLVISSIASGFLLACGASLVVLIWGQAYEPAGRVLLIAAVLPVLIGPMSAMVSATLLGLGHLRAVVSSQAIGAVATLLLDLLLIPPFEIYGAAVANSVGQLVVVSALMISSRRYAGLQLPRAAEVARAVLLLVLIALPGLGLLLLGAAPLLVVAGGMIAGLLMLAIAFPFIKPLRESDVEIAGSVLTRLPGQLRKWILAGVATSAQRSGTTMEGMTGMSMEEQAEPAQQEPVVGRSRAELKSRRGFFARHWGKAVLLIIGLLLGLTVGAVAGSMQKDSYTASTTYAIVQSPSASSTANPATAGVQPRTEPGQLALLTPVIAAVVADPVTSDTVESIVGHQINAQVQQRLIPNSPLIFNVQVSATTAQEAYDVARAYEKSMPEMPKVVDSLVPAQAKLTVVTGAEEPTKNQGLPKVLLIAAGGVVGLLVFAAAIWAFSQRKNWAVKK